MDKIPDSLYSPQPLPSKTLNSSEVTPITFKKTVLKLKRDSHAKDLTSYVSIDSMPKHTCSTIPVVFSVTNPVEGECSGSKQKPESSDLKKPQELLDKREP